MTVGETLDEAFERFSRTGPEFGGGLSNHGPMGSEALAALGQLDAVLPWAEWYARRLREPVRPREPIERQDWEDALGAISRVGDWVVFFERELDDEPWAAVVTRWVGRLAPGVMATHGLLRTAHAVRALVSETSPARRHELAQGLAYWAARYQPLTGRHTRAGTLTVQDAAQRVQRLAPNENRGGLFKDVVRRVEERTDFEGVIDLVSTDVPFADFVSQLTRTFVRYYLANAQFASVAFIHTVTAPSALRFFEPYVSGDTANDLLLYMWQSCAAMQAAFAIRDPTEQLEQIGTVDEGDLIAQIVDARDEHAIKFSEACLREYKISGDSVFIAAIQDVVRRERA